jgi:FkbM family methyltransferase
MSFDFEALAAFEPMTEHRACWHKNMRDRKNAELFSCALGAEEGVVKIATRTAGSSGDTGVIPNADGDIDMQTLDFFNFKNVDLIKIDCEGYEENVLRGAEKTLLACKPVVIVEQKYDMSKQYGLEKRGAVKYLESLGARVVAEISGDYIMTFEPAEDE